MKNFKSSGLSYSKQAAKTTIGQNIVISSCSSRYYEDENMFCGGGANKVGAPIYQPPAASIGFVDNGIDNQELMGVNTAAEVPA